MRYLLILLTISLMLAGCQNSPAVDSVPTTIATVAPPATPTPDMVVTPIEPLDPAEAQPPVLLEIPAIGLLEAVTPMEWEIAEVEGQRTTVWRVPDEAAGWHIDSVGAGGKGNVILSGHQQSGAAVFKPLALGSVTEGQKVLLTSDSGETFVYQVTIVSQPIPLEGATTDQMEEANQYYAPSDEARLTLITGWPDFTTTHRLFVVAVLIGQPG